MPITMLPKSLNEAAVCFGHSLRNRNRKLLAQLLVEDHPRGLSLARLLKVRIEQLQFFPQNLGCRSMRAIIDTEYIQNLTPRTLLISYVILPHFSSVFLDPITTQHRSHLVIFHLLQHITQVVDHKYAAQRSVPPVKLRLRLQIILQKLHHPQYDPDNISHSSPNSYGFINQRKRVIPRKNQLELRDQVPYSFVNVQQLEQPVWNAADDRHFIGEIQELDG
ncbi:hypothetical protein MIMGU_mgv1a013437mg [Erythranthe guttata]|uniref:Uncharacterized protein n=1 Tax=Erythranthe guttata TaxID=4155 RepID=A0A022S0Z6_ERYGU|nr:hypothetical protein MIMGU_mgv1a013437mg [Erythranthe guttata]